MPAPARRSARSRKTVRPGRVIRARSHEVPGLPSRLPITLYLPPGYDESDVAHPVAYMFDGQNLFGDEGSYAGGWHLHAELDRRAARGKTVPIVVAIHHGGATRMAELSPWPIAENHGVAYGEKLLDWIVGPLAAMVAADLRILTGPAHTMIGGSSLGGLLALFGFARHPGIFGKALVMSPSLCVKDGEIFYYVAKARIWGDPRVYLDCGGREARGYAIGHAEWMAQLLERKGFVSGRHFLWRPDSRGSHNERAWRRRVPKALRYLYG